LNQGFHSQIKDRIRTIKRTRKFKQEQELNNDDQMNKKKIRKEREDLRVEVKLCST